MCYFQICLGFGLSAALYAGGAVFVGYLVDKKSCHLVIQIVGYVFGMIAFMIYGPIPGLGLDPEKAKQEILIKPLNNEISVYCWMIVFLKGPILGGILIDKIKVGYSGLVLCILCASMSLVQTNFPVPQIYQQLPTSTLFKLSVLSIQHLCVSNCREQKDHAKASRLNGPYPAPYIQSIPSTPSTNWDICVFCQIVLCGHTAASMKPTLISADSASQKINGKLYYGNFQVPTVTRRQPSKHRHRKRSQGKGKSYIRPEDYDGSFCSHYLRWYDELLSNGQLSATKQEKSVIRAIICRSTNCVKKANQPNMDIESVSSGKKSLTTVQKIMMTVFAVTICFGGMSFSVMASFLPQNVSLNFHSLTL
ncbi:hypothetical protein GQR58_006010 [Nymphon striatum]|nr:hypothetical protein GQR58_006010 [Nymphon striatum]